MAMSYETKDELERSEIELLLPWYATGKLDTADRARVEAFLAAHPDMRRQLDLIREEQEQSTRANEELGYPSAVSIDRLMASVAGTAKGEDRLWSRIADFFAAPSPGGVRWAAAAAGILLLLQAAVIGALLVDRPSGPYQTAGDEQVRGTGPTLIVGFTDTATASGISALLGELDAQIIEGPKAGGLYRIRLGKAASTEPQRQEIVRRLRARSDLVRVVLIGKE